MRRAVLLLVAALLVAGCTALGGGDNGDEEPQVQGLVVEEARLVDTTIGQGQSTELILRVANTNPSPVRSFRATLSNAGPLSTSGTCTADEIPGMTGGTPGRTTCTWEIGAGGVSEDDLGTYPLALRLTYGATLSMTGDTPKFTFTDDLPSRATTTSTFTNGELSMTTTHRPEYAADASTVSIDIALEAGGSGRILAEDDIRSVSLSYSGTLRDVFGFQNEERCTTANFLSGSTSTEITCVLAGDAGQGGVSAGTTYNLEVAADYRYERHRELPITVVSGD